MPGFGSVWYKILYVCVCVCVCACMLRETERAVGPYLRACGQLLHTTFIHPLTCSTRICEHRVCAYLGSSWLWQTKPTKLSALMELTF